MSTPSRARWRYRSSGLELMNHQRSARTVVLVILFLFIASLFSFADVLKLTVDDTIQPISAEFISRGIETAQKNGDTAVLIELRTPGGLESSMRDIIEKITTSPV